MLVAFSVTPLGVGEGVGEIGEGVGEIGEGVGEIGAEAVRVVRMSGLPNRTDAMFTNMPHRSQS